MSSSQRWLQDATALLEDTAEDSLAHEPVLGEHRRQLYRPNTLEWLNKENEWRSNVVCILPNPASWRASSGPFRSKTTSGRRGASPLQRRMNRAADPVDGGHQHACVTDGDYLTREPNTRRRER